MNPEKCNTQRRAEVNIRRIGWLWPWPPDVYAHNPVDGTSN
jgi:hypothetical protein